MNTQITLYHDLRRPKSGNLYPVKLRVWNSLSKKAKLFPTILDLTKKDFEAAWINQKPRKEYQELKTQLENIKNKANEAAKGIDPFTFHDFERKLYRNVGDGTNICYHYSQLITQFNKQGQIGSASSYDLSLKSINSFILDRTGYKPKTISFYEITPEWLKDYENFMVKEKNRSYTTVGIYLRPLRATFNKAISDKEIKIEIYPFGKRKYQIPGSEGVRKALGPDQLRTLFASIPKTPEQQKAKDFWFFSYSCNGMNMKDIALLKFKEIENGAIKFFRAKTLNTSKSKLKYVTAYLTEFATSVIELYGDKDIIPENLVFDIVKPRSTPLDQKKSIQNFTRFVNQHLKKLCKNNGLPEISTYWARHSFATNSVRKGATLEFIQESLGHGSMKTTMNYFAGFENEAKKEFAKNLMNF